MYAPTSTNSPRSGPTSGDDDALTDFDGAGEILRAWGNGLRPDPDLTVSEWAEKFGGHFANDIRKRSVGRLGDKCWVGRPPNGIEMCQSELLTISNEGAVRGSDYPYWHGYVKGL